jgi:hypothetical protein
MDKGITIIGLLIVLLVVIPLVIPSYIKKVKTGRLKNRLTSKAESERLQMSEMDVWDNIYQIGIDTESGKLIYSNTRQNKGAFEIIDLRGVSKCRSVSLNSDQKDPYGDHSPAYRLYLILTYTDPSKGEKVLEFYNNASFSPNDHEMANIQKWVAIISSNAVS